jgi:hypothetical protein
MYSIGCSPLVRLVFFQKLAWKNISLKEKGSFTTDLTSNRRKEKVNTKCVSIPKNCQCHSVRVFAHKNPWLHDHINNHSNCYNRLVQIFSITKALDELHRLFLSQLSSKAMTGAMLKEHITTIECQI